ncbi:MAG: ABC transporter permease [Halioglobus sp.]|nr:ABC transporter permease [Halioglobus sp.]
MQLRALIRKELQLLFRDIHGLALLFVMPVVFILIMSMAMKEEFDRRSGVTLDALVIDESGSAPAAAMLRDAGDSPLFTLWPAAEKLTAGAGETLYAAAEAAVAKDEYSFLLRIRPRAFESLDAQVADVVVAPGTSRETSALFMASLRRALARQRLLLMEQGIKQEFPEAADYDFLRVSGAEDDDLIDVSYGFQARAVTEAPTSVQQNVPAWLVFSMFFVVVPLANTMINERQLGTLRRIRTIPVPGWKLLAGKIIPYYFINQVQVVLMLLVGLWLVPLLGGDRLTLGQSHVGLLVISSALSVAALGFAILVAVTCRSTEQATTLGGAGNIILAALGGIMVPTYVMPEVMQSITVVSPMSWGLQGFLDIFLRGGGVAEVLPEAGSLLGLGFLGLAAALLVMRRQEL